MCELAYRLLAKDPANHNDNNTNNNKHNYHKHTNITISTSNNSTNNTANKNGNIDTVNRLPQNLTLRANLRANRQLSTKQNMPLLAEA